MVRILNRFFSLLLVLLAIIFVSLTVSCSNDSTEKEIRELSVSCITDELEYNFGFEADLVGRYVVEGVDNPEVIAFFFISSDYSDADSLIAFGNRVYANDFTDNSGSFISLVGNLDIFKRYYYVAAVQVERELYRGDVKSFINTYYLMNVSTQVPTKGVQNGSVVLHGSIACSYWKLVKEPNTFFLYAEGYRDIDYLKQNGKCVEADLDDSDLSFSAGVEVRKSVQYSAVACLRIGELFFYGEVKSFTI